MAMTFCEFLSYHNTNKSGTPCCICNVKLQLVTTGIQYTSYGLMCDDCYFNALGDIVERGYENLTGS